jgi:hypothetical protein
LGKRRARSSSTVGVRAGWALLSLATAVALMAGDARGPIPTAFRFDPGVGPELHDLWNRSIQAKTEQVACLSATLDSDTVHISRILPLAPAPSDSLGVSAGASLSDCGPPQWRGTVHTHVALRDGQRPYSLFSGADRGVMMMWWRRWEVAGIFCLLYTDKDVICEIEGPRGAVLFPRSHY